LLKNLLKSRIRQVYLDEANVLGIAAEALPAAHEPVLPDQTMRVDTDPAGKNEQASQYSVQNSS
jgi:hypothetical protein